MTVKETLKNNILVNMKFYIDGSTMEILSNVLSKELHRVEVAEMQSLPATVDNTNDYVISLFDIKKAVKLSQNTARAYKLSLDQFLLFCHKPLTLVEESDVEAYLQFYKAKGNSNVSVNNQLRNLGAIFTWMRKMRLRLDNPCEAIEPYPVAEKPIDHLKPEEWEQLKSGCKNPRDRALIEFLRCTAMRAGEITTVCIKDIDWHNGTLVIYGSKGKRYRTVCLDSVAIKYIREYMDWKGTNDRSPEPLFTHNRGNLREGLQKSGMLSEVKRIAEAAGMERNVYLHLFRKTTATNIIKRGGTDDDAGEYLGHAPKSVTGRHYTYKGDGHVVKIFEDRVAAV